MGAHSRLAPLGQLGATSPAPSLSFHASGLKPPRKYLSQFQRANHHRVCCCPTCAPQVSTADEREPMN
eukprot:1642670-Pyramimonas_sp.AAC.2